MNFSCAMSFKIVQSQNSYYDAVPMCGFGFFFHALAYVHNLRSSVLRWC